MLALLAFVHAKIRATSVRRWHALENFVALLSVPIIAQRSNHERDVSQQSCNRMPRRIPVRHLIRDRIEVPNKSDYSCSSLFEKIERTPTYI